MRSRVARILLSVVGLICASAAALAQPAAPALAYQVVSNYPNPGVEVDLFLYWPGHTFAPKDRPQLYITEWSGDAGVTRILKLFTQGPSYDRASASIDLPVGTYEVWYFTDDPPNFDGPPSATVEVVATGKDIQLVEYYNAQRDHYFMTADPAEIFKLDGGVFAGWQRTGESVHVFNPSYSDDSLFFPVCRLYGLPQAALDTHVFAQKAECDKLKTQPEQWLLESPNAFSTLYIYLCEDYPDTAEIYRLYNGRADVNHRYTTSPAVRDAMVAKGWISEGPWGCGLK